MTIATSPIVVVLMMLGAASCVISLLSLAIALQNQKPDARRIGYPHNFINVFFRPDQLNPRGRAARRFYWVAFVVMFVASIVGFALLG